MSKLSPILSQKLPMSCPIVALGVGRGGWCMRDGEGRRSLADSLRLGIPAAYRKNWEFLVSKIWWWGLLRLSQQSRFRSYHVNQNSLPVHKKITTFSDKNGVKVCHSWRKHLCLSGYYHIRRRYQNFPETRKKYGISRFIVEWKKEDWKYFILLDSMTHNYSFMK